ncbi:hypothetical protein [Rhodopseudomonas sp. B29]|uniref:hypothetical protein n=1 Tax=Rhodopseudomonas sp. B29 TaxID=95607 RepID=UPI0003480A09|nr:hypothetical protein [Rhodopseudomonas sp. B29]
MQKTMVAFALLLAAVSTANAQQQQRSGTEAEQKACSRDVSRFCRTVMDQSDLVILSCLQQNRAKLSKSCNQVLVNHGQ